MNTIVNEKRPEYIKKLISMGESASIVNFCANECKRQKSGEMSVACMFDAWMYATRVVISTGVEINVDTVFLLGKLVEPYFNKFGFRKIAVVAGNDVLSDWENIPRQIDDLLGAQSDMEPAEFYYYFEKIHPFIDGNGRVGQILYNYLNTTLDAPVVAPDMFSK